MPLLAQAAPLEHFPHLAIRQPIQRTSSPGTPPNQLKLKVLLDGRMVLLF